MKKTELGKKFENHEKLKEKKNHVFYISSYTTDPKVKGDTSILVEKTKMAYEKNNSNTNL